MTLNVLELLEPFKNILLLGFSAAYLLNAENAS